MDTKKILNYEEFQNINENEGIEAIVTANGDWSEILVDPSKENIKTHCMFIFPSTFNVTYNSNPERHEYPTSSQNSSPENNAENIMLDIMSGDQNGVSILPATGRQMYRDDKKRHDDHKLGIIRKVTNLPSSEIKKELEQQINTLNIDIVYSLQDMGGDILDYTDNIESVFTSKYIEFLKGARDEDKNVNGFSMKLNYTEI